MESSNGSDTKPQSPHPQVEKKRLNRAPSPARPVPKDVHSRTAKPIVPKSPKFNKQHASAAPVTPQSRVPRRTVPSAKDKTASAPAKSNIKPSATKKAVKVTRHAASEPKPACKAVDTGAPQMAKSKTRLAPIRVPTGRGVCQTDSSSDLSDCPSEPLSDEQRLVQAASSDAESGSGSGSSEQAAGVRVRISGAGAAPVPGAHAHKCKAEKDAQFKPEGKEMAQEELLREIEDLRSENDYLKVSRRTEMYTMVLPRYS